MNGVVFGYLLGSVVQTLILWRFAKAFERYRRAKVDLRNYINGVIGQWETVRNNFWSMLKLGAVALLVVAGVGVVLYESVKGGM